MNILFVSISSIADMGAHSISLDLLRELRLKGHNIHVVCSVERNSNRETGLAEEDGCKILRVKIGKNKKANVIEKGITTLLLPRFYINAIKKYFSDVKFDLVLYPTPPVTHAGTVKYIKKRDGATSYLLLKDIFPQNAVDIGMFSKKSPVHAYFRRKEIALYKMSDYIGCMSQANVDYVIKHNPYVNKEIVHVSPNSTAIFDADTVDKKTVREKYSVPVDKKVFLYGGNLGKPQDIPFVVECLKENLNLEDRFFVISGSGTDYKKVKAFFDEYKPDNMLLINGLPHDEYEQLASACDIGLIFLDHRFTIPNFPSRLLAYTRNAMPVLAATDVNTDIGKVIESGEFGLWCESNDAKVFKSKVDSFVSMTEQELLNMGEKGKSYMKEHFSSEKVAEKIISLVEK